MSKVPEDWLHRFGKQPHTLILPEMAKYIPKLYDGEDVAPDDKIIWVKIFHPGNNWTWYVTEYDPESKVAFGLVEGFEDEWGYFSITEIEQTRGFLGLRAERDLHFSPRTYKEVKNGKKLAARVQPGSND